MHLLRRLLGILVLLLSTVCFIGCIAAIVGAWTARRDLAEKTRTVFGRLDVGLERASAANRNVGRALEKARADVAWFEKELDDFEKGETHRPPGAARRLIWQELGGAKLSSAPAAALQRNLRKTLCKR